MNDFSPGPWSVESTEGKILATMSPTPDGRASANARLVAAAPRLMEACLQLLAIVEFEFQHDLQPEELESWRRAIDVANEVFEEVQSV